MLDVEKIDSDNNNYVYDISLDGTVVNALGMNIVSNTDGINMQLPKYFRYTEAYPYISDGSGKTTIKGKSYVGLEADVAEFEDYYLGGCMSLGIDELVSMNIALKRKTYIECLKDGNIKIVGNALKNITMLPYIKNFIKDAVKFLANGDGLGFINLYYTYIDKIYNYQMPLKDIVSVGVIDMPKEEYLKKRENGKIVYYELALKNNLPMNVGDSVYYINIGNGKDAVDFQETKRYYIKGIDKTASLDAEYKSEKEYCDSLCLPFKHSSLSEYIKSKYNNVQEKIDIKMNCALVDNATINADEDIYCKEDCLYNVDKYIDKLNRCVSNFLCCFSKDIRYTAGGEAQKKENIIITKPSERKYFTSQNCALVNGIYKEEQDTYEEAMSFTESEEEFWKKIRERGE